MELDDPSQVKRATPFDGVMPALRLPRPRKFKLNQEVAERTQRLQLLLDGWDSTARTNDIAGEVQELFRLLADQRLPVLETRQVMAAIASRLPKSLSEQIKTLVDRYDAAVQAESAGEV